MQYTHWLLTNTPSAAVWVQLYSHYSATTKCWCALNTASTETRKDRNDLQDRKQRMIGSSGCSGLLFLVHMWIQMYSGLQTAPRSISKSIGKTSKPSVCQLQCLLFPFPNREIILSGSPWLTICSNVEFTNPHSLGRGCCNVYYVMSAQTDLGCQGCF